MTSSRSLLLPFSGAIFSAQSVSTPASTHYSPLVVIPGSRALAEAGLQSAVSRAKPPSHHRLVSVAGIGAAFSQVALVFSLPQRSQRNRVINSPRCTAKGSLFTGRHLWCPFRQSVWLGFCGFSKRRISAMRRQLAVLARLTACCQDSNLRRRGPVPMREGNRWSAFHTLANASVSFQIPTPSPARKQAPATVVSITLGRIISLPR